MGNFDSLYISFGKISIPFARFSLFLVYFWFGALKLFGQSPANPLVESLLEKTLPFVTFDQFILFLGTVEVAIGIGFLIPSLTRILVFAVFAHMATTIMPLFLLPQISFSGFLVPTLEGQYIIKNILIIALTIIIAGKTPQKNIK
jgi:uncharacterized membrane protein YkgB